MAKHVESYSIPCLDGGSTPPDSTTFKKTAAKSCSFPLLIQLIYLWNSAIILNSFECIPEHTILMYSSISLKMTFIEELKDQLKKSILESNEHLKNLVDSRNSESKSSAGDKHETSRAMVQQEIDMLALQQSKLIQQEKELNQIDFEVDLKKVKLGNMVLTDRGLFLISIGYGKIELADEICFAISPVSPMAQALLNKSKGENVQLNGRNILIEKIV